MFYEYYGQANYEDRRARELNTATPPSLQHHQCTNIIYKTVVWNYMVAQRHIFFYLEKSASLVAKQAKWHIGVERIAHLDPAGRR